ncbi:MAG TPA: hypothetical protein VGL99_06495 [Chloroflexota bacterium]
MAGKVRQRFQGDAVGRHLDCGRQRRQPVPGFRVHAQAVLAVLAGVFHQCRREPELIQGVHGHESDNTARHYAGAARKFAAVNLMTKCSPTG